MGYPESFNELAQWRDELRGSYSGDALVKNIEERVALETDSERLEILNRFLVQEHIVLGNHAAAEAIYERRPDQEIYRWHRRWREEHPEADAVPVLEDKIRGETHPARLITLRLLLVGEHLSRNHYLAAEAVHLADSEARRDSPRPLIALAKQKLHRESLPEDAMRFADRAVAVAMRAGVFRREALGLKARIAVELSDYIMVESVLREVMHLTFTRGNLDIDVERDFFDELPPGGIDPEVATAYHEYCNARGRRRTPSDRQMHQFILAATRPQWLNVARIIAEVLKECERNDLSTDDDAIAGWIGTLVADGKLEAQGSLANWCHSEVRLGDADNESLPARSIAGRVLTMQVGRRAVEVPITIYAPVDKGDHWRCMFEIGWPDKPKLGAGNGIDAPQALLIALKFVGAELYASKAHADGRLKCPGERAGYGFPLPWTMREEAEGEDRYL